MLECSLGYRDTERFKAHTALEQRTLGRYGRQSHRDCCDQPIELQETCAKLHVFTSLHTVSQTALASFSPKLAVAARGTSHFD